MKHIAIAILLLLAGCGNQPKKQAAPPVFPRVEVPAMVTDPQAQADYTVQHFWDSFDFADTLFLAWPDMLEQQFVDYIAILPYVERGLAQRSIASLMAGARADSAMYRFFADQAEHYLWDPNSPYRNDEFNIPVLENLISFHGTDTATLVRSQYRLELALKNRPGTAAADFDYTLASGQTRRMSQLRSEYLLLFFNNPGCPTCAQIMDKYQRSPLLTNLQGEKRLAVLAVFTEDAYREWSDYQPQMPAHWVSGYDRSLVIRDQNLYDLKAVPTLYLLDKDKKVLLKDTDIEAVEAYLQRHALN